MSASAAIQFLPVASSELSQSQWGLQEDSGYRMGKESMGSRTESLDLIITGSQNKMPILNALLKMLYEN